jgi:hypothetical protein
MAQVDQEMRDLLIRLDQRVGDGFAHLTAKLDAMELKHEGHEQRLRSLEHWRTEVRGGAKGIGFGWKVVSVLSSIVIGVLATLGVQFMSIEEKPAQKTPIEVHKIRD